MRKFSTNYKQGIKDEQKRIIELMRNQICDCFEMTGAEMEERFGKKDLLRHRNHDFEAETIRRQISLIKGKQL